VKYIEVDASALETSFRLDRYLDTALRLVLRVGLWSEPSVAAYSGGRLLLLQKAQTVRDH